MKKRIITLLLTTVFAIGILTGCGNKDIYAIIQLPNGEEVEGEVESWKYYDNGKQLQIKIDGTTYLTSTLNCTLVVE